MSSSVPDFESMKNEEIKQWLRNHPDKPSLGGNKNDLIKRAKLYAKNIEPPNADIDTSHVLSIGDELKKMNARRVLFRNEIQKCSVCDKVSVYAAPTACCSTITKLVKDSIKFSDIGSLRPGSYPSIPDGFSASTIEEWLKNWNIFVDGGVQNAGTDKPATRGDHLYNSRHVQYVAFAEVESFTLKGETLYGDIYLNDILIFQANIKATMKSELR